MSKPQPIFKEMVSVHERNNSKTGVKTYEQSVEDFWIRVDSSNLHDPLKCWEWTGHKHRDGYGWCSFQGKKLLSHRASYIVHFGAIPCGLCVCHRCDNPGCVNPNHLFVGTHTDNMRDMVGKGRGRIYYHKGEKCPAAKLTEDQVRYILSSKEKGVVLAKRFLVSDAAITLIRKRKNWSHVSV